MKMIIINIIVFLLLMVRTESAVAEQGSDEIDQIRDYIGLSRSYIGINNQKALELAKKALDASRLAGVDSLKARSHRFSGIASYYLSDFNQSLIHYDSALYYFTLLNDSAEQARIHNNKGALYTQLNLFHKAIAEYLIAMDIHVRRNNTRGIIILYNNIGGLYQYLSDYEKARYYYLKTIEIAGAQGFHEELINALNNIATLYELEKNFEMAESAYRNALEIAEKRGSQSINSNININFGAYWIERKQPDSALIYFTKATKLNRDSNLNLDKLYLGMARAYKFKGQGERAINYYNLALDNLGKGDNAVLRLRILKELAEMLAQRSDYEKAYRLLIEYADETELLRTDNDSLTNTIIQQHFNINNLELAKDSLANNLAKVNLLTTRIRSEKNTLLFLLFASAAGLVVLGMLLFYFFKAYKRQKMATDSITNEARQLTDEKNELIVKHLELSSIKELLNVLVAATPNPLGIKNADNEWLIANASMRRLMGIPPGHLENFEAVSIAGLSERSDDFLRMLEVAEELVWMKSQAVSTREVLPESGTNELKTYQFIRVPVYETDGARKYLIIYAVEADSKTRKHISEEIARLHGAFSVLSHEIRTPLNAVLGFSEILADESTDPSRRRQYLRIIQRNGNVLLKLMDDLLTYISLKAGNQEIMSKAFNFRELFIGLHTNLVNKALEMGKHNLEVRLDLPDGDCVISSDEVRWQHILNNLSDNAIRFTQNGHVTIGFRVTEANNSRSIMAFVEDSGPGISPEMQSAVFEPFVRLNEHDGKGSGAGLGLSIVKLLAQKMQIKLEMKSKPGKGTRIELHFSGAVPAAAIPSKAETVLHRTTKLTGKKVLIVEDTPSNTELLLIILEGAGAKVMHVSTGEEAIKTCLHHGDIDLVLMDIQLPKMSGLEATREIKSFRPDLPIIAHTAYAMANDKDACFEAGCDGYVAKPIKPKLLLPILEKLFEK
ncbi:MAG TPA: response regulator [Bacteroidales bacterium]|nr:response regulator [Bacteroidales bacterium]